MEDLLLKALPTIKLVAEILGGLVVVATVVAKLTPTPKDDKFVSKVSAIILKVLKYLPTIGVNPETKKLEKAYEELKK